MTPIVRREFFIVLIAGTILILLAAYSISYARSVVRDDLRKQDITNLKRALESYNNTYNYYVGSPTKTPSCTKNEPDSWFFGNSSPLLQEQFIDAIPHDVREKQGFTYSYCVTMYNKGQATGFYLDATLESNVSEGIFFDEDEKRKFDYRIILEDTKKTYRVCGGEETQCKTNQL